MKEEDADFEEIMKQGDMFHIFNGIRTCKTCAYAMPFKNSVVCGVWHSSFSDSSFCDHYKTEDERQQELKEWERRQMANPNSLLNRMKK